MTKRGGPLAGIARPDGPQDHGSAVGLGGKVPPTIPVNIHAPLRVQPRAGSPIERSRRPELVAIPATNAPPLGVDQLREPSGLTWNPIEGARLISVGIASGFALSCRGVLVNDGEASFDPGYFEGVVAPGNSFSSGCGHVFEQDIVYGDARLRVFSTAEYVVPAIPFPFQPQ